jgi:hypothetical protein
MNSTPSGAWLPTSRAALALGCSPEHLKRQRDVYGGFLEAGHHYALGSSATAAISWDVAAVRAAFHRRGMKARQELITTNRITVGAPSVTKGDH